MVCNCGLNYSSRLAQTKTVPRLKTIPFSPRRTVLNVHNGMCRAKLMCQNYELVSMSPPTRVHAVSYVTPSLNSDASCNLPLVSLRALRWILALRVPLLAFCFARAASIYLPLCKAWVLGDQPAARTVLVTYWCPTFFCSTAAAIRKSCESLPT